VRPGIFGARYSTVFIEGQACSRFHNAISFEAITAHVNNIDLGEVTTPAARRRVRVRGSHLRSAVAVAVGVTPSN
jgi:hypothetical protein